MVRSGGEMDSLGKDAMAPRRHLWAYVWRGTLALLLCCVALVLVLRWHWRREFSRRIEAIRAAGYPATPQELDAWYKYPQSGVNAAHWIMEAGALYVEPSKEDWERLLPIVFRTRHSDPTDPARALDPDLMRLLEQYVQVNSTALKSLYDGAAIDECRYPTDLSKGAGVVMTHISHVREGMLMLCLEAVLHAERGDPNRAVEAIQTSLHVTGTLDDEPVMVSHMVAASGASVASVTLERMLNRVELTDAQLETLCEAFLDRSGHEGLLTALVGERCLTYPLFDSPQTLDRTYHDHLAPKALLEIYDGFGLAARDGIGYLGFIEECIRIAQSPVSRHGAGVEAARARWLRDRKSILFSQIGYGAHAMIYEATHASPREMARVLLAVERFRLAHGTLPDAIDSLVPQYLSSVPEDPHDGKPLRYKRLDRGYMVYSVGEDGRDDGGKQAPPKDARKSNETWDFVFQVRR